MVKNTIGLGMKWVLAGMLVLPFSAWAGELWTDDPVTNAAWIAANTLIVADWAQTRYSADNPDRFYEEGLAENFIGMYPETREVNQYFASAIILTNLIGYILPEEYKGMFYVGVASFQANTVQSNNEIGVRMKF
jgi:hypothetical protein